MNIFVHELVIVNTRVCNNVDSSLNAWSCYIEAYWSLPYVHKGFPHGSPYKDNIPIFILNHFAFGQNLKKNTSLKMFSIKFDSTVTMFLFQYNLGGKLLLSYIYARKHENNAINLTFFHQEKHNYYLGN